MSKHFVPPLSNLPASGTVSYQPLLASEENAHHLASVIEKEAIGTEFQCNDESIAPFPSRGENKKETSKLLSKNLESESSLSKWPPEFHDEAAIQNKILHPLPKDKENILREVRISTKIRVRSITWNQQAQEFPPIEKLRDLLQRSYYHVLAVGTQECENTITKSILYPRKDNWEKFCAEALGSDFKLVRGHSLQATHLAVYVHKAIFDLTSNVASHAVATGLCDKLGNKGGIAITLTIGRTEFCFLTSHLSAHQNQMDRRTVEFGKISREVVDALRPNKMKATGNDYVSKPEYSLAATGSKDKIDCVQDNLLGIKKSDSLSNSTCCICPDPKLVAQCIPCCCLHSDESKTNPLPNAFDYVIWGGDLNFRIHGTRHVVDLLLAQNRHDLLLGNDQLNMIMQFDTVFASFAEGPLSFRPTYKFDKESDKYDTSSKQRIPAWTDRILYKIPSKKTIREIFLELSQKVKFA